MRPTKHDQYFLWPYNAEPMFARVDGNWDASIRYDAGRERLHGEFGIRFYFLSRKVSR